METNNSPFSNSQLVNTWSQFVSRINTKKCGKVAVKLKDANFCDHQNLKIHDLTLLFFSNQLNDLTEEMWHLLGTEEWLSWYVCFCTFIFNFVLRKISNMYKKEIIKLYAPIIQLQQSCFIYTPIYSPANYFKVKLKYHFISSCVYVLPILLLLHMLPSWD